MQKEYRPIPGFSKYGISKDGEIKTFKTGHIKTLCLNQNSQYYVVNLYNDEGKACRPLVHRLVALTYLPNPNNLPQVNHKDENKFNNNVDNLEWCSISYNLTYGTRLSRVQKATLGKPKPREKQLGLIQIHPTDNIVIDVFKGAKYAAEAIHMASITQIRDVANHKQYRHTAGGYRWEYIEYETYQDYVMGKISDKQELLNKIRQK